MSSRPSRGAARLAAILDALPDGLVLVNCNGTVVNANTIALEMFEAPGTALVGRGLLDLLPAFDSKLIPGSMRRPDSVGKRGRTKPTRMVARRTDGGEFPAEVTSAGLEDGRAAYASPAGTGGGGGYTGDELLMLVVRDLSGTIDTEAELARSQRQTEMILRAAAEGVVGTDTDGRVVLVNPAAAQILGFRASDLGGEELHPLILHSRPDGEPFPYDESPLADTLKSGRKHRVRGQVLWAKNGKRVPVDLTTAPVRDGEQLVGAVMTFTDRRPYEEQAERHAAEIAARDEKYAADMAERDERHAAELAELTERHLAEIADRAEQYTTEIETREEREASLTARHAQLAAVLGDALRGPLEELRRELGKLAADPAGQLWPEANQILHHLAAGYARMTTLVDNVLGYQMLDSGAEGLHKGVVLLDAVVAAGVEGAVELIGPGRAQFAVHAPPIEAEVDGARLATALAHLVADVAGIDSTGKARTVPVTGYVDSTIVVAAAQRGDVVRIEVRGPYSGGDPVHAPIVRGIVTAHGGVLQTHEVPGTSGSAYVLEVPLGGGAGAPAPTGAPAVAEPGAAPEQQASVTLPAQTTSGGGRRRARRASTDAFLESPVGPGDLPVGPGDLPVGPGDLPVGPGGTPGAPGDPAMGPGGIPAAPGLPGLPKAAGRGTDTSGGAGGSEGTATGGESSPAATGGTGRRRGRPSPVESGLAALPAVQDGLVVTAAEAGAGRPALGDTVPPQGVGPEAAPREGTGRRARRARAALPALPSAGSAPDASPAIGPAAGGSGGDGQGGRRAGGRSGGQAGGQDLPALEPAAAAAASSTGGGTGSTGDSTGGSTGAPQDGRRARRVLATGTDRQVPAQEPRGPFALPPAEADRTPPSGASDTGRHDLVRPEPESDHTPPRPHPVPAGRRRARPVEGGTPEQDIPAQDIPAQDIPAQDIPAQVGQVPPPNGSAMPAAPGPVPPAVPDRASPAMPGPLPATPLGPVPPAATGPVPPHTGTPPPPDSPATPTAPVPPRTGTDPVANTAPPGDTGSVPLPPAAPVPAEPPTPSRRAAQPLPAEAPAPAPAAGGSTQGRGTAAPMPAAEPVDPDASHGRAFSVRTLGQGVSLAQRHARQQDPQAVPTAPTAPTAPPQPSSSGGQTLGSGRRRKLATRQEDEPQVSEAGARPHPASHPAPAPGPSQRLGAPTEGRAYAIGAPDEGAEGPEPLDGPGGAIEVANRPTPLPRDDELPPEPLDNPRRLLVWPAPDVATQKALIERGYRPVIVHSREEVDAQIAAFPAALFVDPLTGPITRTALQALRQAAVAAGVPVLLAAGLGQATREAAYGADPAVLLKALAPRDSEQHPSRVLLIEQHEDIAAALTATLERRGMQVARAAADADAVALAQQTRPNLVVMDLMQVRRHRAGIIDWLRANGQLNRTPLVVYTSAGLDQAELPRLSSGETVLFLAERSTNAEVQGRIVDLLAKIGTN
ncbi:PAS domain-containing protein [Streptomyces pacificus]|uniref:PAS domain-containing protein n=1 Tax=Streptomyces pacificus TaxID=2705029 RepID=A0A6A0B0J3_9ACTN|nr:PAS domain-containing protein [Streptomyces pacificus]GFH38739.1 PAS domain-containing protein [Streptomyces pacificus]